MDQSKENVEMQSSNSPLCLFYFSHQGDDATTRSYGASTKRSKPTTRTVRGMRLASKTVQSSSGDTDETAKKRPALPPRRRKDDKRKLKFKRFTRDKPHNLTSFLLSSANTKVVSTEKLPPLIDVLSTIQDAWPSQNLQLTGNQEDGIKTSQPMNPLNLQSNKVQGKQCKLGRRRSVPEEIIRKYSLSKDQTSPESETTATMPDVPSSSGKEAEESTERAEKCENKPKDSKRHRISTSTFSKRVEEGSKEKDEWIARSCRIMEEPDRSEEDGSSDSDSDAPGLERFNTIKRAPLKRESAVEDCTTKVERTKQDKKTLLPNSQNDRVSQKDFYEYGQGILCKRFSEKYSQTGECACRPLHSNSGTTPSAHEDTESAESSDTISSPTLCTRQVTSSDNQSSDSEGIPCTCTELTSSKDTSTDPYHSGKSTLSQSVSDKSVSTQDSTISIRSMSTGGSSNSAASGTSSPDIDPKTSAKETTTSPEHSPRQSRSNGGDNTNERGYRKPGNGNRNKRHQHDSSRSSKQQHDSRCPRYQQCTLEQESRQYRFKAGNRQKSCKHVFTNIISQKSIAGEHPKNRDRASVRTGRTYEWAIRSVEEATLKQEQMVQRFLENNREFITPTELPSAIIDDNNLSICSVAGSVYHSTENLEHKSLMVPRYSALPKSLSMVVNTSSLEISHNSDSESIADSLEEDTRVEPVLYYDTKNETKPVRGDADPKILAKKKWKHSQPRGRAYFVSLDNEDEEEIVASIYKIPEPPDRIKNNIFERHANICKNRISRDKMHKINEIRKLNKIRKTKRVIKAPEIQERNESLTSTEFNTTKTKLGEKGSEEIKQTLKDLPPVKRYKVIKKQRASNSREALSSSNTKTPPKSKGTEVKTLSSPSSEHEVHTQSKIPVLVKSSNFSPGRNSDDSEYVAKSDTEPSSKARTPETNLLVTSKPQAIIHPSSTFPPSNAPTDSQTLKNHRMSLISSLESAATALKTQQFNSASSRQQLPKHVMGAPKRQNNVKFQQKFEAIPEERSSSLSSDERKPEKDRRRSLPVKLSGALNSHNPTTSDVDATTFRRYSLGSLSNYLVSQLMGRPLQAIPCIKKGPNNENQEIILFSPKDELERNSAKGRDALIAMNREDFDRLSKGWMNFYLLKEDLDENGTTIGEQKSHSFSFREEQEVEDMFFQAEEIYTGENTLGCRILGMEMDSTTSCSGDDTGKSPRYCSAPVVEFETLKERYSLLLKDAGTDRFVVQECTDTFEQEKKGSPFTNYGLYATDSQSTPSRSASNGTNAETALTTKQENSNKPSESNILNKEGKETVQCIDSSKVNENFLVETKEIGVEDKPSQKAEGTKLAKRRVRTINKESMKLSDDLKFNSSSTVLRTTEIIDKSPKKFQALKKCRDQGLSLPELQSAPKRNSFQKKTASATNNLPRVDVTSGSEYFDSDSTVYMEAPGPHVPPLYLDGFCDCLSDSLPTSSEEEIPPARGQSKQSQSNPTRLRKKTVPVDKKHIQKRDKSGWSVTVAGSVVFPNSTPDVQMKLSFPSGDQPPIISQSDSGFIEDRPARSRTASQRSQEWTVTVKNPRTGTTTKEKHVAELPFLKPQHTDRTIKRVPKNASAEELEIEMITRKMPNIWSNVQDMIQEQIKYEYMCRQEIEKNERLTESNLLVSGQAVSFDKKPKLVKMSHRDISRNSTARTSSVLGSNQPKPE